MTLLNEFHAISTREEIPSFLVRWLLNQRMCEVGVRFGYNLERLLSARPEILVGVDHWFPSENPAENDTDLPRKRLDDIYKNTFKKFVDAPPVKLFRGFSTNAAEMFPNNYFDYVYLDADHSFSGCFRDISAWWGKVKPWGILAGHDYCERTAANGTPFGVIKAVSTFRKKYDFPDMWFTDTVGSEAYPSWLLLKGVPAEIIQKEEAHV